jgi:hypothetical protein
MLQKKAMIFLADLKINLIYFENVEFNPDLEVTKKRFMKAGILLV